MNKDRVIAKISGDKSDIEGGNDLDARLQCRSEKTRTRMDWTGMRIKGSKKVFRLQFREMEGGEKCSWRRFGMRNGINFQRTRKAYGR